MGKTAFLTVFEDYTVRGLNWHRL